nr:MAG TPA: hypothetical protein [Bacteriophage sp.]
MFNKYIILFFLTLFNYFIQKHACFQIIFFSTPPTTAQRAPPATFVTLNLLYRLTLRLGDVRITKPFF